MESKKPAVSADGGTLPALEKPPSVALVKASLYTLPPVKQNLLTRIWQELVTSRWIILGAMAAGLAIGLGYNAWQIPLYEARASIEVQGQTPVQTPATGDNKNSVQAEAATGEDSGSTLETQVRILESRAMLQRALNHLPEGERQRMTAQPRLWEKPQGLLESVTKNLEVRPSLKAHIIDISFLCPDAQAGADFANSLAQELSDYTLEREWKAAQRSSDWLQPQLNEVRTKLEASEKTLDDYVRGGTLAIDGSDIEAKWATARSDRLAAQVLYEHLRTAPLSKVAEMSGDAALKDLERQANDLESQMAGARAEQTGVLQVQASELQRSIARRRVEVLSQAKADYMTALAVEKMLRAQIGPQRLATLESAAKVAPEKTTRYALLKREAEANRQLYEALTTRITEAKISSGTQVRTILLLDSAYAARTPTLPNTPLDLGAGLAAGTVAGLLFVLLRRLASPTFSQPGTLSRVLSLPELGAVPVPQPRMLPPASNVERSDAILPFSTNDDTDQSESYRAIRSSLLYQTGDNLLRCLVFTSAIAGEGKTTVVSNLSMSLAATNRRVLIIDGDLRRPTLHKMFGVAPSPGLSDLLRRERLLAAEGKGQFVVETAAPNLFLLPCGTAGGDAPELLAGNRLPALLKELQRSFDLILIDTPPMLCADARSFAKAADGVVLVVRANETNRRAAGVARDTLLQDGSAVIGTVLTGFRARRSSYGYQGYSTTT